MSEIGDRLRRVLDETEPADLDFIVRHEPVLPVWRVGRSLAYAVVFAVVVAVTVVLMLSDDRDETASESTTASTIGEGTTSTTPATSFGVVEFVTNPLSGEWYGTNPDTEGLLVITNDMIWDGDAFYVLTRLGFGDHVVWRSADGIGWEIHKMIAAAGELEVTGVAGGPTELVSVDGQLVAAGSANGRATVWIDDGSAPWTGVAVGTGRGVRQLVHYRGRFVALVDSEVPPDGELQVENRPTVWVSTDALHWRQAAGEGVFGRTTSTSDLAVGPSGLLMIGYEVDPNEPATRVSAVFRSPDGESWSRVNPTGLDVRRQAHSVIGGDFGYAALVDPFVYTSPDGSSWTLIEAVAGLSDGEDVFLTKRGLAVVEGRLVLVGGVGFVPPESEYNTMHPRVWSLVGDREWTQVGEFEWFARPGILYEAVVGDGSMVVLADTQDDGPEEWGLLTFVASSLAADSPESGCGELGGVEIVPRVGLPAAVEQLRVRLSELAAACDLVGLAEIAATGAEPFEYPLQDRYSTPDRFWAALENNGTRPMGALVGLLSEPHTSWDTPNGTVYGWPAPIESSNVEYEAWVTISADGEWLSYVIPDRLLPEEFRSSATEVVIAGTRQPYTFDETQSFGEFGPLVWHLVTTVNGTEDIPHGPGYEWVEWGPNWAGHQPDDGPDDVYGVTDMSIVDVETVAARVPVGTTIVLREVRWSLDELEDFKDALGAGAPENGVCSTGFGFEPNRVRITATTPTPDFGNVPAEAVWLDEVYDGECPSLLFGEETDH